MDEDTGVFKLVPVVNTTQRSIFDSDFQQQVNEQEGEDGNSADSNAIEGRNIQMLPGPNDKEKVIEFREMDAAEAESEDESSVRKCITGWSGYGICSCCGYGGVQCCNQCEEYHKESCNSRCGWIDEPHILENKAESAEELEDITNELLGTENPSEGYSYEEPEDNSEE